MATLPDGVTSAGAIGAVAFDEVAYIREGRYAVKDEPLDNQTYQAAMEEGRKRSADQSTVVSDSKSKKPILPKVGFLDLDQSCRLRILSFVNTMQELASLSMTCLVLATDCRHEDLDQRRQAVINCQHGFRQVLERMHAKRELLNNRFPCIKFINAEKESVPWFCGSDCRQWRQPWLEGVTSLDLSLDASYVDRDRNARQISWYNLNVFLEIMPNIHEIDFSCSFIDASDRLLNLKSLRNIKRVQWHNGLSGMSTFHGTLFGCCDQLEELYLDDFCFEPEGSRLLEDCRRRLRRVSLKGAKFRTSGFFKPLSPRFLSEFVRGTPTLEWFKSDLSETSIASLQDEHPRVEFC